MPLISICISAYKRVNFLQRLLDSISIQSFRDFEIIIADDSPDNSVYNVSEQYQDKLIISYFKNPVTLGSPKNWNEAISHAKGEWIKLMHDDDWFSTSESLKIFVDNIKPDHKFIFSGYTRVYENKKKTPEKILLSSSKNKAIEKEPMLLFANNFIGPPSVTLVHQSINLKYDETLKWRVDIDFYIRVLQREREFVYIDQSLVNVGMSESQITQSSINDPGVELPEGWIMLQKYGVQSLKDIRIYDAWWRMFRNMNIKTENDLKTYADKNWPPVIFRMLGDLRKTPDGFLRWGLTSKLSMAASFLKNRSVIK
jgi:glycosyltransferase involved in cell wall biosynthesis